MPVVDFKIAQVDISSDSRNPKNHASQKLQFFYLSFVATETFYWNENAHLPLLSLLQVAVVPRSFKRIMQHLDEYKMYGSLQYP